MQFWSEVLAVAIRMNGFKVHGADAMSCFDLLGSAGSGYLAGHIPMRVCLNSESSPAVTVLVQAAFRWPGRRLQDAYGQVNVFCISSCVQAGMACHGLA